MKVFRIVGLSVLAGTVDIADGGAMEPIADTIDTIEHNLLREQAGVVGGHVSALWLADGDRFMFTENGASDLGFSLVNPVSGRITRLTDDATLRAALAVTLGIEPTRVQAQCVGLADDSRTLFLRVAERVFAVDARTLQVRAARDGEAAGFQDRPRVISNQFPTTFGDLVEARAPDGKRFITVKDANLFVRSAGQDSLRQLTSDGAGRLTWLNTQESAQAFNVYWSPDSRHIAAVQLDARDVWHEPLPHWLGARPQLEYVAYPRAGERMHRFRLAIIDVDTRSRVVVETGDTTDHYVDILGWRADGGAVFYQTIDREHKQLRIFAADATTGKPMLLLWEGRPTYLDTTMTLGIQFFFPLGKSNEFLYLSERDGWRHLYRYAANGTLIRRLTQGSWPVAEVVAIDEQLGWVYFRASQDASAPYDLQLFRVPLQGGEPQRLTSGSAVHRIVMAPSRRFFLDEWSSSTAPPVVELRAADGRSIRVLSRARVEGLLAAGFSGIEPFVARSAGERWDMHGIIAKPHHFAATKRYPVLEIIYAGMQSVHTPHDFYSVAGDSSDTVLRSLVNSGFVVVVVDAPGTPGRGKAFQDATYGIWPQTVIDNHVRWIEAAAKSRPWMDLRRVGVYGHSWGAYMAQRAMIDAPQFYKVAVGHAGPSDFADHPTYIEPFMGLPQNNRQGYETGSNLTRVERIRGPVLVMAMPLDVNAGFSPAMKFVEAMIRAKKDVDLVIFPESSHRINCCGADRELYGVATIERYFRSHLSDEPAGSSDEAR